MDASLAFDDIGHSEHAKELLKNFLLGSLAIPPPTGSNSLNGGKIKPTVSPPPKTLGIFTSKW
jgi:cytochrome b involved in lipid metabolism